jgi:hypothetical protein
VDEDQVTLEYAATPRRRWRWRRCLTIALVAGVTFTALHYREPIGRRARLLYWQHKCLTYTRPAGTPVGASPACWQQFELERRPVAMPVLTKSRAGSGLGTLFLRERISKAGHPRLVRVEQWQAANALAIDGGYDVTVIQPGTLWNEPTDVGPRRGYAYSGRAVDAQIFFAQVDPNESDHFWFYFTATDRTGAKRSGTVDAWLNDDDTVTFKLSDPASTRGL